MSAYKIEIQEPGEEPGEVPDVGFIKLSPALEPEDERILLNIFDMSEGEFDSPDEESSVLGIEPVESLDATPWDQEEARRAIVEDLSKNAKRIGEQLVLACGAEVVYGPSVDLGSRYEELPIAA